MNLGLRLYDLAGKGIKTFFSPPVPERRGELPGPVDLWLHASSVGEATVAAAIMEEFYALRPDLRVILTLFTPTGKKKAQELLVSLGLPIALAPYDIKPFVQRALTRLSPRVLALIETELWPRYISLAKDRGTKVVVLNGRLSARSYPRYLMLRCLFAPLLARLDGVAAVGEIEAKRFKRLGVCPQRLFILGNAKHDLLWKRAKSWDPRLLLKRLRLSPDTNLVVFGSVRQGEEAPVTESIALLAQRPRIKFAIVPRHLTHLDSWENALSQRGLSWQRWSSLNSGLQAKTLLVDAIGPLFGLYSLAKVAFVGGSLVPKGGQNPMEPASFGVPVLFGPHMENFETEKRALLQHKGGLTVSSPQGLVFGLEELLADQELYKKTSLGAQRALQSLLGAAKRQAQWLSNFF